MEVGESGEEGRREGETKKYCIINFNVDIAWLHTNLILCSIELLHPVTVREHG